MLPNLRKSDYYTRPSLKELAIQELVDPGYCSRVVDFTVGRFGYGFVKFLGETDVRWLDLDQIVDFRRHQVVVYEDEDAKPIIGQGLNKPAEVTLVVRLRNLDSEGKLRLFSERQGARFISYDSSTGCWKFFVKHFSRFGLSEDDEEDLVMDDVSPVQDSVEVNRGEVDDVDEVTQMDGMGMELSHSLPAHLGLDPVKMKEMRMLMFPAEEEESEDIDDVMLLHDNPTQSKDYIRAPLQLSAWKNQRSSPSANKTRKTPLPLLEYKSSGGSPTGNILMAQQKKGLPLRMTKIEGFKLDLKRETPVTGSHSHNVVDAALFMGRSFRVGWGPNGVLVHAGSLAGNGDSYSVLSSVINVEKVAIDNVVRDENNKVREELIDLSFEAPLNLHREINHETKEVEVGPFKLKLQKLVSNRVTLSEICRNYIGIVERQLEVPGISASARVVLMHQVMVWELIKVLFSEREMSVQSKSMGDDNEEDMMQDRKEAPPDVDLEALPLIRRAEFSFWLQECVFHRVQEEVSCLNGSSNLEHIFLLMTGRQLDASVELASSRGDVRLACLLSQAGGSMVNRADVAQQLDLWRSNGLDFRFIEKERIRLYELLAGNIHGALHDKEIDWRRFLGLLMWYQLPPDISLSTVFHTYQNLLDEGKAPQPVPIYIDEDVEEAVTWSVGGRLDLAYYLMLLHATEDNKLGNLKTMFSAFSSTYDPLDHHMIWHQRAVLEAIGAFTSIDLHVLDMGLVNQLLCSGQCHWAIYVVLHMTYDDEYPYLQATLIREILYQYCETWSSDESQRQFIEDLGIPSEWLHEAMAIYFNYLGDLSKALENFLLCGNWQKAHTVFVTSVAHSLFLSAKHSEVCGLATSMEDHKSEIEDWDLGAGIYVSFYLLRNSLHEDGDALNEMDSLENKDAACRNFFSRLNESLAVLSGRLPIEARVAYSKMAEEICGLLLSDNGECSTREAQLSCFETMISAPIPEDLRSCHLQDAVSLFTCFLMESAS
ncbi:Nuclear pore complex protein NUP96, C-terminal domain [Dillenia turbinata]|uniref:Nuclear pore complex protein NUP96, C-terminal domain n=1 Tax=Dillenia turbinata TaxID=194707 RepID=A0AAN8VXD6_9MAGN